MQHCLGRGGSHGGGSVIGAIGFDIEWRPNFRAGGSDPPLHGAAATGGGAQRAHRAALADATAVKQLLRDPALIKTGVGILPNCSTRK